jgi:glycosyltransferase involved in cell wall biosynthesis
MRNPLISIIIPTYNSGRVVEECISSILTQTHQNFEVIISDGLSVDNTLDVLKRLALNDKRIKVFSEKDCGIYDAMNKGIDHAAGDWLFFLGSDDRLFNESILEEIFQSTEVTNYEVIYGNVEIHGDTSWAKDKDVYDGIFDKKKLTRKNISHQSIFYRRDFIRNQIGYYNSDYTLYGDWDFNLRCRAKTEFLYINKIIAKFYSGGESTKTQIDQKFTDDFLRNVLCYFNIDAFDPLVNDIDFGFYEELLKLQKMQNYLKFTVGRVKRKLL